MAIKRVRERSGTSFVVRPADKMLAQLYAAAHDAPRNTARERLDALKAHIQRVQKADLLYHRWTDPKFPPSMVEKELAAFVAAYGGTLDRSTYNQLADRLASVKFNQETISAISWLVANGKDGDSAFNLIYIEPMKSLPSLTQAAILYPDSTPEYAKSQLASILERMEKEAEAESVRISAEKAEKLEKAAQAAVNRK